MAEDASIKKSKYNQMSQESYERNQQKWFDIQKKKAVAPGKESSAIPDDPADAKAINPPEKGEKLDKEDS